ncbi:uncharacterized protein LOC109841029 isoform X1 [Asparagus officinalis]|uniref:uncharacterized protein LOC109841029 isoform X1 n=1 Tax=Asparagus officinalis TaxID=4686 RepID=UPI00098E3EFA|nr:uncharacterized protein LOC109841029 isoform X1 [Asparagus officinalis]XP_020265470.1 uncharacterized protein LOC109841029 isoform X1 [Asparagus officinalis]
MQVDRTVILADTRRTIKLGNTLLDKMLMKVLMEFHRDVHCLVVVQLEMPLLVLDMMHLLGKVLLIMLNTSHDAARVAAGHDNSKGAPQGGPGDAAANIAALGAQVPAETLPER